MKKISELRCSIFTPSILLIFGSFISIFGFDGVAHAYLTAKANHDHITIDFFYHGSTVSVKGESDAGADIVVKITSPEGHQTMKKKGKVGGLLWMNVGTITFGKTPNLYEVFSTKKLDDILSVGEQEKHVLGYTALVKHVSVEPAESEQEKIKWFNEFVKFKEDSRLYLTSAGKVETTQRSDGRQDYAVMTAWPYQAAPGEYSVTVYAVKNGKVAETAESTVRVDQIGMVKTLASMAKNNAALYGMLSIGIALGAGFGVGMIFRKGGGSH